MCCPRVRLVWPKRPKKVKLERRISAPASPIAEVRRILRGHGATGAKRRRRRKRQRPEKNSLFYTILYCDVLKCQPTAKWTKSGKNGGWVWQRFGRKCFCKIL